MEKVLLLKYRGDTLVFSALNISDKETFEIISVFNQCLVNQNFRYQSEMIAALIHDVSVQTGVRITNIRICAEIKF